MQLSAIREQFPGLAQPTVLLDNAGGSQLPACVIDAAADYMRRSYVQLGADYDISRAATATVAAAHAFAEKCFNAGEGRAILGSSTTALVHTIANAYADAHAAGRLGGRDRIVVSTAGHEANIWPWLRLRSRGLDVVEWHPRPNGDGSWSLDTEALRGLLGPRALLVAFPHVSNILGDIWDAAEVTRVAHQFGARVCIDGVAYAPHRAIDVRELACDWYVYSLYKVFGPHMGAMYGSLEALAPLEGPNHPFIRKDDVPYKFEPGGVSHEGCAMIVGSSRYFRALAGDAPDDRAAIVGAYRRIERLEHELADRLLTFLRGAPGVKIHGGPVASATRVCTIAFSKPGRSSRQIAQALNARGLAVRFGHFYSKRLVERIGLDPDDGVVRASPLHYNTPEEIDRLIAALRELL
ncbi:MAG: aminotransferase class V-fold PLP-dependent enzyme [Planctomycetes bacterium]|nr:aminotransferase class V-fold PLP-dependent enzyme [Planctomycetota bacterium]